VNAVGAHVLEVVTPAIFPPGSIVWHMGPLRPEEIQRCQWLTFVGQIHELDASGEAGLYDHLKCGVERLRADYDAFETFLRAANRKKIFTLDKTWTSLVEPQAFDYQSPARQSPYLIRAMLNLGSSDNSTRRVLDPMGGYGQALFECVLREIDGATLEISPTASRRSAHNLRTLFQRLEIAFEEHRDANSHLFLTQTPIQHCYQIVNGDTRQAGRYFPAEQFDTLVTDFPYDVRTGTRSEKLTPIHLDWLLDTALPGWKHLLKPGGMIAFAYNRHTLAHEVVLSLMKKHGFHQRVAHIDLSERISQRIHRDIVTFEKGE